MKKCSVEIKAITQLKDVSTFDPMYRIVHHSIQEYGFVVPVIVSRNHYLLDGHKACKAQQEEGNNQVSAIYMCHEVDLEGAWRIHRLLNEDTDFPFFTKRYELLNLMNEQSITASFFHNLDRAAKPVSDVMALRLLKHTVEEMPFSYQKRMHDVLSSIFK